ncbi:MAG TPA: hypothetical protein VK775_16545 [Chthoniobacterales bacterium]|jgi:hypothetical protein|nr:hypothetical protein [Chthoniobacterales bacterium]
MLTSSQNVPDLPKAANAETLTEAAIVGAKHLHLDMVGHRKI